MPIEYALVLMNPEHKLARFCDEHDWANCADVFLSVPLHGLVSVRVGSSDKSKSHEDFFVFLLIFVKIALRPLIT